MNILIQNIDRETVEKIDSLIKKEVGTTSLIDVWNRHEKELNKSLDSLQGGDGFKHKLRLMQVRHQRELDKKYAEDKKELKFDMDRIDHDFRVSQDDEVNL